MFFGRSTSAHSSVSSTTSEREEFRDVNEEEDDEREPGTMGEGGRNTGEGARAGLAGLGEGEGERCEPDRVRERSVNRYWFKSID